MYFEYGAFFPHFLMNREYEMDEVTDVGFDGKSITYAKSQHIQTYSDVMRDNWALANRRRKKKLIYQRLVKHENLHRFKPETEISWGSMNSGNDQSSTASSSRYILEKLSSRYTR